MPAENAAPTPPAPSLLLNVYPNPFNPELHFHVDGQVDSDLQVQIFNVKGQLVETIHPTETDFVWHAGSLASGVYFCKLLHQHQVVDVQKVTILK